MSNGWQLAQLNIATLSAPLDSPRLADFVRQLDAINALAEQSDGFIWRLVTESGNATDIEQPFGDDVIVNMSVWESVEALHSYVYRSAHAPVMARRKEWFERMSDSYTVLWWVPKGHRPTVDEAEHRLLQLRDSGPTPEAFTFKRPFAHPDPASLMDRLQPFDDDCPLHYPAHEPKSAFRQRQPGPPLPAMSSNVDKAQDRN